ncbi:hypothetical protein HW44_15375 [Nitrosococcus oceani]|nr:hypothetical protein HW44_15375 [Nitrosococcus oceani]
MPRTANGIEQKLLAGKSFLASLDDSSFENRNSQLLESFNNHSMYEKGWKTNVQHTFLWQQNYAPGNWDENDREFCIILIPAGPIPCCLRRKLFCLVRLCAWTCGAAFGPQASLLQE